MRDAMRWLLALPPKSEVRLDRAAFAVSKLLGEGQAALTDGDVAHDGEPEHGGTKPLIALRDERGGRWALKLAEPALLAAEEAAYCLRRLGGRPGVPGVVRTVRVDGETMEGLLMPWVALEGGCELPTDTRSWSELQRSVMLLEHAWEWFLDNLDANTSQYVLVGPEAYPVNIDWDRAFAHDGRSELSRFAKYKVVLPNARTFLYADYVEGRVDLPLSLLRREARRIRLLSPQEVRRILESYARVRYVDAAEAAGFIERMLDRQASIEEEVGRFIRELLRERLELAVAHRRGPSARLRALARLGWNQLQVVLQGISRGAVGRAARRALRAVRGRRLSRQASD